MKISVFQIVLLAIFGALAVAGLLIFAFTFSGNSSTNTVGKVVIWGTLDKNAFNNVLDAAVQNNQDLSGITYVQKDSSTYDQDLTEAFAEQKGPDLFIISSDDAVREAPKTTPIPYTCMSAIQFQNDFVDSGNPFLGKNGVVALPFVVDPLVLYWNRDLLGAAGYSTPPATWDEVPAMAQTISTKDVSGAIKTGAIAFGTYQNIEDAKAIMSILFMQAANLSKIVPDPITTRTAEGTIISSLANSFGYSAPPAVSALSFYTEFANPAQTDYSWNNSFASARSAFAQGQAALYVGFASENALIHAINPNLNYSMALLPQLQNAAVKMTYGRIYAFALPLNTNTASALQSSCIASGPLTAAELLDTASTTEALARGYGMASALRSALARPESPDQALINKMAIISKNWTDPDPVTTDSIFRDMIENTVSGASSPQDAITHADQQILHIGATQ